MDVEQLQMLRMTLAWPVLVATVTGWLVVLVLRRGRWLTAQGMVIAAVVASSCAWLVAQSINLLWNDGESFWVAFTMGLCGATLIMAAALVWELLRLWKHE